MEAVMEKPKIKQKKKKVKERKASENEEVINSPSTTEQETDESNQVVLENEICNESTQPVAVSVENGEAQCENSGETECEIKKVQNETVNQTDNNRIKQSEIPENPYQRLLNTNKELIKDLQADEAMNELTKAKTAVREAITQSLIRPYTESQLASLYRNTELEAVDQFMVQFLEAELKGYASKRHPLYGLLENYLAARSKVSGNSDDFDQQRDEYKKVSGQVWTMEDATVTGRGVCNDGVSVSASQTYVKSTFHRSIFQTVERILNSVRRVTTETHVLYSYLTEISRLQIELYLHTLSTLCINGAQVHKGSQVSLSTQDVSGHLASILSDLRLCISVLFSFQRRQIRDSGFNKETKSWLSRLVALLLRVANWQDHLFLLNHVLRCPSGVGSWAAHYIQIPLTDKLEDSPFANYAVNHVVTIFSVILTPIQQRGQFLEQLSQDNGEDSIWTFVDTDSDDDDLAENSLKEDDLVRLLNQVPLDNLFRCMLLIQQKEGKDYYDFTRITDQHILKFLSFSTVLLKILVRGLETYEEVKYRQFCKRLCRLVRHVMQYVTDLWEQFKSWENHHDRAMLERLQVEYDAFLIRTASCLFKSQKCGAWHFLAALPYHLVSLPTLWKIFYLLHGDHDSAKFDSTDVCSMRLQDDIFRAQFEEKLAHLDAEESCYLLNALCNMILARKDEDMEFIEIASMDLMMVGFVSETTRETCSKNVAFLLAHITSKHPHLITNIIKCLKLKFSIIGAFSLYNLFEELPLLIWKPTQADSETIISWLTQNPITSNESRCARMILSRLNWDLTESNELYLPHTLHFQIAMVLAQMVEEDPSYLPWAWQTAYRLRLHYNDKGLTDLTKIPDLKNLEAINRGVRERKPFSCFLAVLTTACGHLVPVVCSHGFALIEIILASQKYDAVLFLVHLIVPLFLDCQESLVNSEKFQEILVTLINVDRSYINMAKSLVITQTEVVKQFGNMINYQIDNFRFYNLDNMKYLVRLWTSALVSIQNWNKDSGVLYLLDVVVKASFFHTDALNSVVNILRDLLQCVTPQETNLSISSLFKWASLPQGTLLISSSLPSYVWLAFVLISLEHEEREGNTGLWREVLNQLNSQKGKVNVDAAIKKAASIVKVPSFTSSSLCIYRWAQQALDTELEHPLLPLLWQKFFILYLTRIPVSSAISKGCLGEKFFNGIINLGFLKRLKSRLKETVEFYFKKTENCDNEEESEDVHLASKKFFYQNCLRIFRAYSFWLEEPRVQENNLHLPSLPPQYEAKFLALIIQGSLMPWFEFIDYEAVKLDETANIKNWKTSVFREKSNANRAVRNAPNKESSNPMERILARLTMYDTPKPPPEVVKSAPVLPPTNPKSTSLIKELEIQFETLHQFAHNHTLLVSDYKTLDLSYLELVKQQYTSVLCKTVKKVSCKGQGQMGCTGQADIQLEMNEARLNANIDHQIQTNRNNYEALIAKSMQTPAQSLCTAAVSIQMAIENLAKEVKCNSASPESGVELFYHVLSSLNDEINAFSPTRHFYLYCLEQLGKNFIHGVEYETPRLLNTILGNPKSLNLLVPHFSPINVGSTNFLHMYSTICKEVGQRYDVLFQLLQKFDISNWLVTKQPKLVQRVEFIKLVVQGLTLLNFEPPSESLAVHEIYRTHLVCIFEYQFPEHHIDVITGLLNVSQGGGEGESISTSVWFDILNSLAKPRKVVTNASQTLRIFAQQQKKLNYEQTFKTAHLLGDYFKRERLQYGLFGLYPKQQAYVEVLALLTGMTGHALIVNSLTTHQGMLGDKVSAILWGILSEMFAPWTVPYWILNMKDNMTNWMQQLTDDRSVLLPWRVADGPYAQKMVQTFSECVQFLNHTIPGSNSIFNHIWQWYVNNFAHSSVKEHILNPVHASFISLPWNNFWPSVNDVELMLKLVEQYLPECHMFLGHIFFDIPWANWLRSVCSSGNEAVAIKVHQCLLHLMIKLSKEPNVRSHYRDKAVSLFIQAESFNWDILEPALYQNILDWYVMSCDPLVLFLSDPTELDFQVMNFLRVAGDYHKALDSPTVKQLQKRHIYIRSYVKLVSVLTSKCKTVITNKTDQLNATIRSSLLHMEAVVKSEPEFVILLEEMFSLLSLTVIKQNCITCYEWFHTKPGDSVVLRAVLQSLGSVPENLIAAHLYENAINSYFFNSDLEKCQNSWQNLGSLVRPYAPRQPGLEQILVAHGNILTLNVLLIKKISTCDTNGVGIMNTVLQWLQDLKINSSREDKVPLLWFQLLFLAQMNCQRNERDVAVVLQKFSQLLLQLSTEKGVGGWGKGFLGALGIVKQDTISLRFKFLCRALAGYLLAQLPDTKGQTKVVRNCAHAPGTVGQPGGNTECVKVLLGLDFGQTQGEIKGYAESALKMIQNSTNSLHNSQEFLALLVNQLYTKPYLKDIGK